MRFSEYAAKGRHIGDALSYLTLKAEHPWEQEYLAKLVQQVLHDCFIHNLPGKRVDDEEHGVGTVVCVEGENCLIEFEGAKSVLIPWANLERVYPE